MERDIQFDYPALVTEAIKRRKAQRITQKQLATLIGISKPTLVKFESQATNIELSSVIAILKMLGLARS